MRSQIKTTEKIEQVAECLNAGGVALIPTDTVFGLAARPDKPEAIKRIFKLKDRPVSVNLPILVPSAEAMEKLGAIITPAARKLIKSDLMPGALTLVLELDSARKAAWLDGRDECAVRMPASKSLLALMELTGPICATSANLHGSDNQRDAESLLAELNGVPDIVLAGQVSSEIASTVINCRRTPCKVERIGQIPAMTVAQVLRNG